MLDWMKGSTTVGLEDVMTQQGKNAVERVILDEKNYSTGNSQVSAKALLDTDGRKGQSALKARASGKETTARYTRCKIRTLFLTGVGFPVYMMIVNDYPLTLKRGTT